MRQTEKEVVLLPGHGRHSGTTVEDGTTEDGTTKDPRPAVGVRRLSYVHRGGASPLLGETVGAFVADVCRRVPANEAVVSVAQHHRTTYAEFDAMVEQLARGLLSLGIAKGDRVGILATDNTEWVVLQLATARVGAVLVNINPACRPRELRHAMETVRPAAFFLIPSFRKSNYVEMLCELYPELTRNPPDALRVKGLPDLRHVVVYEPDDADNTTRPEQGFLTWPEVMSAGFETTLETLADREASLDPDDPINIQFTSGTTGFAKPVVLTHHNILNNGYFVGKAMGFTDRDRLCVPVPFYHCFGMVVSNLACLTHGATIVIPAPHFEPGATLVAIQNERCTAIHGVPSMFIAELERPDFESHDLSSLRTGIMAGAPCPPELLRRVFYDMGCREILIAYGQTESSPVTHITRPDDSPERRVETVGTNLPHQEVKIVDAETGVLVPLGESGEVCFRGYHVMRGYFEQKEATRDAIDEDGWLHSGDLGALDEDGYLRITGRLKDMIIRGGENIYPAEIEAFYHEHPKVASVAVFGVPDTRLGEEIGAWVQLHEGMTTEPDELRAYARERIAHFKVPKYLWIVDDFPMTVTGKVQKFKIKEIVQSWRQRADGDGADFP